MPDDLPMGPGTTDPAEFLRLLAEHARLEATIAAMTAELDRMEEAIPDGAVMPGAYYELLNDRIEAARLQSPVAGSLATLIRGGRREPGGYLAILGDRVFVTILVDGWDGSDRTFFEVPPEGIIRLA